MDQTDVVIRGGEIQSARAENFVGRSGSIKAGAAAFFTPAMRDAFLGGADLLC